MIAIDDDNVRTWVCASNVVARGDMRAQLGSADAAPIAAVMGPPIAKVMGPGVEAVDYASMKRSDVNS